VSGNGADKCSYILSSIGDPIFYKVILHGEKKNNDGGNEIVTVMEMYKRIWQYSRKGLRPSKRH
jgi:hypothetical protein